MGVTGTDPDPPVVARTSDAERGGRVMRTTQMVAESREIMSNARALIGLVRAKRLQRR
jgi:hypothetical protein